MDNNYTALFRLVQAAMGNSNNSLPDNVDWGAVVDLAARHGVGAVTMDGLNVLFQAGYIAKEQIPPIRVRAQWGGLQQYAEQNYDRQQSALRALDRLMEGKPSKALVFKGISLSLYFPVAKHRECCDIDMYAMNGCYDELEACLLNDGGRVDHHDSKHASIKYKNAWVELHHYFLSSFVSPKLKRMNAVLENLLTESDVLPGYNNIYRPSKEFDILFVLIHAANHYKIEGISIRHIIDWALILKSNDYVWQKEMLEDMKLLKFASILNRIARENLGFDIPNEMCQCADNDYKRVLNDILYPQYESQQNTSKANLLLRKYKRFTSRKWTYPLVGDNFWRVTLASIIDHIVDPTAFFRGNR